MPRGVSQEFLDLLQNDRKVDTRRAVLMAVLAVVLAAPAWFIAGLGGLAVHGGAVLVGLLAGFLAARARYDGRYATSLMDDWGDWMEQAHGSDSVAEVARRARRRSGRNRPLWYALAFTAIWALEVILLGLAFTQPADLLYALPILAANGLAVGVFLAYHVRALRWADTLRTSIDEMVQDGELGVWGVR